MTIWLEVKQEIIVRQPADAIMKTILAMDMVAPAAGRHFLKNPFRALAAAHAPGSGSQP